MVYYSNTKHFKFIIYEKYCMVVAVTGKRSKHLQLTQRQRYYTVKRRWLARYITPNIFTFLN